MLHTGSWDEQRINPSYQEMAEHYGTAIIPARVRTPKDKPNAEGIVGNISTWIIAALRNERFFSLYELNNAIRQRSITSIDPNKDISIREVYGIDENLRE